MRFSRSVYKRRAHLLTLLGLVGAATTASANSVTLNGQTYINHGLVGVGELPANLRDKYGETFGSFSAFTFGDWTRNANGSYSGTLYTQPDRGYNAANTTDYTPRYNQIGVQFTPAPGGAATRNQAQLTLVDTVKYTESSGAPFTSLDPTNSGSGARPGLPPLPQAYNGKLSLDAEGIVRNSDGSFFVSDEYGPYIYRFSASGQLQSAIRPPEALIPKRNGADSFNSNTPGVGQPGPSPANPTTGRQNNQGLEGLTVSPDGTTLYALLQSATRQDGGTGASGPRGNTRLLAYDLATDPSSPTLKSEYVVQLPSFTDNGATRFAAQSELLALDNDTFLMLARDGNGFGTANATSLYRNILLLDVDNATNIAGTAYDLPTTPIAPGGNLALGLAPVDAMPFIDMNDPFELAKFGLHNGGPNDATNLSEKWEALALVPMLDPLNPNSWYLFVGNDNDFLTTDGFQAGLNYAANVDNPSRLLVYQVELPSSRNLAPVPEPSTYGLVAAAALVGLAALRHNRRRTVK